MQHMHGGAPGTQQRRHCGAAVTKNVDVGDIVCHISVRPFWTCQVVSSACRMEHSTRVAAADAFAVLLLMHPKRVGYATSLSYYG